ncbi:MAG: GH3 auxin-responsive promoter family protein [Bacteroidales bacterium]|nr:GH3 auxin-responsive promoter family protein [Bacteroidales bacterium]
MLRRLRTPILINLFLRVFGGLQTIRLKRASQHPRLASERTLREILKISKDTVYGKEHHFEEILAAPTDEELFALYQHLVPANDFEALRPYVERHKNGETNVLFPGRPVMYATTSGTTAQPKWVPMTHKYLKDVYGKMSHVWTWNFVKHRRLAMAGHLFPIVGKECEGHAPDGTLYGSVSGVLVRDLPNLIKRRYTAPVSVMSIEDYAARNYTLMRLAVQYWDVTIWATANPSTILELQRAVDENLDTLIDDIEHGTLSDRFNIAPKIREELKAYMRPRPDRANELRKIRDTHDGRILPKYYWPKLKILSTWKCGNTKVYMEKYLDYFDLDKTFYQELGYIATECRFGFSLDETNESVMFPHLHYYEFVAEEELDSPNKHFLQLDELEYGHRYCAYVTTYSGLFRYNMNDLIEVGGKFENTPTIHMVSKINGIVSLTGEKLYEPQFIDAVKQAEKESGIKTTFFVGFADVDQSVYHFYFEFEDPETTEATANEFAVLVDKKLCAINIEYASKRDSFRLQPPIAHRLIKNAYARFKAACLEEGMRDGQFKFNQLMQDEKRRGKFQVLVVGDIISEVRSNVITRLNQNDERVKKRLTRKERRYLRRAARQTRQMGRKQEMLYRIETRRRERQKRREARDANSN